MEGEPFVDRPSSIILQKVAMLNSPDPEILNSIVRRVFRADSITIGDNKRFIVRYVGSLLEDSEQAYERLAADLDSFNITPLFRKEDGTEVIYLMPGVVRPKPSRLSINIGLFILTLISVLFAGVMYSYDAPLPEDTLGIIKTLTLNLWRGWPFAVSLLAILSAHEFGHYFADGTTGRRSRCHILSRSRSDCWVPWGHLST